MLGRTSAGLCTLQTACPLTVTYSSGTPAADTIASGSAATVYGGSAATFDASADVWVVLTVAGSGALQVVKEADLATVTDDWAGLARVVQHSTEPYQPQAYLAAGGTGAVATPTTTTVLVSSTSARALSLGTSGSPPAGWYTPGFDDSAWGAAVLSGGAAAGLLAIPGTILLWSSNPGTANEKALFRQHCTITLPSGTHLVSAQLLICDDGPTGGSPVYVNGTSVGPFVDTGPWTAGVPAPYATITLPPGLLVAGDNLLAAGSTNDPFDANGEITYLLQITTSTAGAEGDLLYFHSGVWTRLPLGTTGQELTVVAGDPAWATPAAGYTDPLSTKGDLLTRSSSATVRLGVGSNGQVVTADSTAADGIKWATPASSGVTSIDVAVPAPLSSTGGPVTATGTITLSWASGQTANRVLASPDGTTGAVSLRALVAGDIPNLPASQITSGQLATARGGTGLDGSGAANGALLIGNGSGYALATLTAGSGVTITNGSGTVTIASSGGGSGTVTSVTLSVPGIFAVSPATITTSGTFSVTLANENAASVFAGPASGSAAAPTFRALQGSDLPAAAGAGGHIHAHVHLH